MEFVCDICKEESYVDDNGLNWWGVSYKGTPDILKLFKTLEGQNSNGVEVLEVFKDSGKIKVKVQCEEDLQGLFLSTELKGEVDGQKNVVSVDYNSVKLCNLPVCKEYSVKGLEGFIKT